MSDTPSNPVNPMARKPKAAPAPVAATVPDPEPVAQEPEPTPEPAPAKTAQKEWRIEIRHTPCGAHARLVRTQTAASAEEAWEKFKVAVHASMFAVKTQQGQATLKAWDDFLSENKGKLPRNHGRIITEAQAVEELNRSMIVAPPETVRA